MAVQADSYKMIDFARLDPLASVGPTCPLQNGGDGDSYTRYPRIEVTRNSPADPSRGSRFFPFFCVHPSVLA